MARKNKKTTALIFSLFTLIAIIAGFGIYHRHAKSVNLNAIASHLKVDGTVLRKPRNLYAFNLTDDDGKPFTLKNLKGHWSLLFFGFTNCGYVCPTTLASLNKMYNDLKEQLPNQLLPQVIMVSLDPARDSYQRMHNYVTSFNKSFKGIRGNAAQTKAFANQFNVVYSKVAMKNGNYMISHSAEIMMVNPDGKLRAFFSYPHKSQQMIHDYELVVRSLNH